MTSSFSSLEVVVVVFVFVMVSSDDDFMASMVQVERLDFNNDDDDDDDGCISSDVIPWQLFVRDAGASHLLGPCCCKILW